MFTGEGVGASHDNFSTNLARLKNLRQRFGKVHSERDAVLTQITQSDQQGTGPESTHAVDLHWLAKDQREWLRNEHHTTLEFEGYTTSRLTSG